MKQHIITSLLGIAILCSCTTTSQFFTPSRVQTVVAFGAYEGAQQLKAKYEPQLKQALVGLQALQTAGTSDLPAIYSAVVAALGPQANEFINSDEGKLAFDAGALLFTDLWSKSGQVALNSAYGVAVRDGLVRGLTLALQTRALASVGTLDSTEAVLKSECVASRKH